MEHARKIVGAVVAAMFALIGPSAHATGEDPGYTPVPVIKGMSALESGVDAPPFVVKDLDGKSFDFGAEMKQRAHLLVFWSIFCEPCREEMPIIEKVANEYGADGKLGVLAVNLDGEPFSEGIRGFLRQYKYSLRVLLDELRGEEFAIADPYRVAGTPVIYLVDAGGKIRGSHLGRIGEGDLKALVDAMVGGP
jgi:thiol-disulfide isomerase/thioredoxin